MLSVRRRGFSTTATPGSGGLITFGSVPGITGDSEPTPGSITHGQSVTTTGSGFGTKSPAAPTIYDDFTGHALGISTHSRPGVVGTWDAADDPEWVSQVVVGDVTRGVHSRTTRHTYGPNGQNWNQSLRKLFPAGNTTLYIDFWMRMLAPGGDSRNQKVFRVYPNGGQSENDSLLYVTQLCDNDGGAFGGCGSYQPFTNNPPTWPGSRWPRDGSWFHVKASARLATPAGTATGRYQVIQEHRNVNQRYHTINGTNLSNRSGGLASQELRQANLIHYCATDGDAFCAQRTQIQCWGSCAYIDSTWARVELGNASTYTSCTITEIQRPTAWSNTSITYVANRGLLSTGANYEYVFDSTDTLVSTRQVTIA